MVWFLQHSNFSRHFIIKANVHHKSHSQYCYPELQVVKLWICIFWRFRSSCLCSWSCDSTKELTLLMNKNIDCEPLTLHHICVDGNNGQPALNVLDKVYWHEGQDAQLIEEDGKGSGDILEEGTERGDGLCWMIHFVFWKRFSHCTGGYPHETCTRWNH